MMVVFLLSKLALAVSPSCEKHPIYCNILEIKSDINKAYAMKLSNVIYRVTKKYKLNATLFTAILAQESMFKLNAKNCTSGWKYLKEIDEYTELSTVCSDFGIAQIHYKTIELFNFDVTKLLTNLEYSVEAGAIVLSDIKKRYRHKENKWWSRYNSSSREKREMYQRLVERYFPLHEVVFYNTMNGE